MTPLLKKSDLDPANVQSYRPIANLSVLSKLLERLVAQQLLDHLNASKLLPDLQSAYRAHYSSETAVVKVLADIMKALNGGDLAMLTLLDLSATFDTVDHGILLRRLETSYGLQGCVLKRFICRPTNAFRPLWSVQISPDTSSLRSSPRVGPRTDPVPAIHSGPRSAHPTTRPLSASLRRRHSNLRYV